MKKLTQQEWNTLYYKHTRWRQDNNTDEQLILTDVDLSELLISTVFIDVIFNTVKLPPLRKGFRYYIENSKLSNVSFENEDIRNSEFRGTSLKNVNFKGTNISKCTFHGSTFKNIQFDSTTGFNQEFSDLIAQAQKRVQQAQFDAEVAEQKRNAREQQPLKIISQKEFDSLILSHNDRFLSDPINCRHCQLKLKDVDLSNIKLSSALEHVILENVKLPKLAPNGHWHIYNSKLTNVLFSNSDLMESVFYRTELTSIDFSKINIKNCIFEKCIFEKCELIKVEGIISDVPDTRRTKLTQKEFDDKYDNQAKAARRYGPAAKLDLSNYDLSDVEFNSRKDLRYSKCINTKFPKNCSRILFGFADLTNADFENSNCSGSNFVETIFKNTNFKNSYILNVVYSSGFGLGIIIDENTKCSDELRKSINEKNPKPNTTKNSESNITKNSESNVTTPNSTPNSAVAPLIIKKLSADEFHKKYRKHEKWLNQEEDGVLLNLSNCDLSDINLEYLNLSSCICENTVFPKQCKNVNFTSSSLTNVNFQNGQLGESNFRYATLTNVNFINANISECNFELNVNLESVKFNYRTLVNVEFIKLFNKASPVSYNEIAQKSLDRDIESHERWQTPALKTVAKGDNPLDLSNLDLRELEIKNKVLKYLKCENTKFGEVINVTFEHGVFNNIDFSNRIISINFLNSELSNVNFVGNDLSSSSFENVILKECAYSSDTIFPSDEIRRLFLAQNRRSQANIGQNDDSLSQVDIDNTISFVPDTKAPQSVVELLSSGTIDQLENIYTTAISKPKMSDMSQSLPERITISQSDFTKKYGNHALWIQNPKTGIRLDLSNIDLSDVDISKLNFTGAKCNNTLFPYHCDEIIFDEAELINCDLDGCDLDGSSFKKATLKYTNLKNACLDNCIFDDAVIENIEHTLDTGNKVHSLIRRLDKIKEQNLDIGVSVPLDETVGIVQKIKQNVDKAMLISAGNQTTLIIYTYVNKILIRSKVPKNVLENPIVKKLIMMLAPQLLTLALPYLPITVPDKVRSAFELSCTSSVAMVTEDVLEKITEVALPSILMMITALEKDNTKPKKQIRQKS